MGRRLRIKEQNEAKLKGVHEMIKAQLGESCSGNTPLESISATSASTWTTTASSAVCGSGWGASDMLSDITNETIAVASHSAATPQLGQRSMGAASAHNMSTSTRVLLSSAIIEEDGEGSLRPLAHDSPNQPSPTHIQGGGSDKCFKEEEEEEEAGTDVDVVVGGQRPAPQPIPAPSAASASAFKASKPSWFATCFGGRTKSKEQRLRELLASATSAPVHRMH